LNFGQMLMWHILLLPLVLGLFVVVHVLLVRKRGVVPPFPAKPAVVPALATEVAPVPSAAAAADEEIGEQR
jgi:ubiquinol-cytochrome c reductase cytochrome b subunit